MDIAVLNLLNGISFGAVLFLLASGLSLILGVMGILNLAHGAIYMIGAYVGWSVAVQYELNYGLAVLAGGIAAGLIGLTIERVFLRHLHGQPLEQVLLTVGLVYVLTNISMWVWGARGKPPFIAPFLSGSFDIVGWSYPIARIAIIAVGLIMAIGLWWLQDRTRVGAIVRAGMDDKEMTGGLGINLKWFITAVFMLGTFMAGFAGVIGAQLLGVSQALGWDVLLLAFAVIVIGGMGSIQGALLGAMLIGLIDAFGKALFPDLALFTIYLVMIIILLIRPSGLMGKRI